MQQSKDQPPWRYTRPTSSDPTPHILIGGPELDLLKLPDIFRSLGLHPDYITPPIPPRLCCCYASFTTIEQATSAIHTINNYDLGSKRRFAAQHADVQPLLQSRRRHDKLIPHQPTDPPIFPATLDATSCNIPGLQLIPDFISIEEEQCILDCLDAQPWDHLAKRRIQHYGKVFNYAYRTYDSTSPAREIPAIIRPILDRIHRTLAGVVDTSQHDTINSNGDTNNDTTFDQLTVNEYTPGVGISPHVETHSAFTDVIVSLSLAGTAVMSFRRTIDGELHQKALFLPERSLLVLRGEARFAWEHSIPHRKKDIVVVGSSNNGGGSDHDDNSKSNTTTTTSIAENGGGITDEQESTTNQIEILRKERRVSLTFRKIRNTPCRCNYPDDCDDQNGKIIPTRMAALLESQQKKEEQQHDDDDSHTNNNDNNNITINNNNNQSTTTATTTTTAQQLEDQNVRDVYDIIAPHFSSTRFAIWPKVRLFINSIPTGAVVADVGCGNGKYFAIRRDIFVSGSDRSKGLAEVASRRLFPAGRSPQQRPLADVAIADGMNLPYRSNSCDAVLCIAVLHHVSTVPRRVHMLGEMAKVLRKGGRALVTVWATEQENMKKVSSWQPLPRSIIDDDDSGHSGDDSDSGDDHASATTTDTNSNNTNNNNNDYLVPWHLPTYRVDALAIARRTDGHVDAEKDSFVFKRYYHLFVPGELEGLVGQVDGVAVIDSFYDKDNWCVIFEKL